MWEEKRVKTIKTSNKLGQQFNFVDQLTMGIGNSTASLAIELHTPVLVPGTMVCGKIYLIVHADKVDGEQLVLRLTGVEFTRACWEKTNEDKDKEEEKVEEMINNASRHCRQDTTCTFLDMPYVLSSIPQGYFLKGQYEFPFQFMLPIGVPPSMQATVEGREGGSCCIYYKMEAHLHRHGWFTWDVKQDLPLCVLSTPTFLTTYPLSIPPQDQVVNLFCCFPRGHITVGLHCPTAILHPEDTFTVSYILHNHSYATITAIEFTLLEKITWSSGTHQRQVDTTLYHQLVEVHTGSILPTSLTDPLTQRSSPTTTTMSMKALQEVLEEGVYAVQGRVCGTARSSVTGRLITVSHTLRMTVCTAFGYTNPSITLPITICSSSSSAPLPSMLDGNTGNHSHSHRGHGYHHHHAGMVVAMPNAQGELQYIPVEKIGNNPVHTMGMTTSTTSACWCPNHIAPEVILPPPRYMVPVEGHPDSINPQLLPPTAPPLPLPLPLSQLPIGGSVEEVYHALQNSYSPLSTIQSYLASHPTALLTLTPNELGTFYTFLPNPLEQVQVTDLFVQAYQSRGAGISCDHIVAVIRTASPVMITQIVSRWAKVCVDKEQYRWKIESMLSTAQYATVAKDFIT